MGDFVRARLPGRPDRPRRSSDSALQWNDVAPFFRDFSATFKGKVYTIPLDGDFQMVYYRRTCCRRTTFSRRRRGTTTSAIAKQYQGQDLNGDGKNDYGSCSGDEAQRTVVLGMDFGGGGLPAEPGDQAGRVLRHRQHAAADEQPGLRRRPGRLQAAFQDGPPDQLNNDVGDSRGLFITGRCALSLDWGDIGTLAIDTAQSKVLDKVGAIILPGSKQVLDRSTNQLADCNATLCPNAVNGVNHAPFAAFGGWSGAINESSAAKVEGRGVRIPLLHVSQPAQSGEDVTIGKTGFNPYRTSHFTKTGRVDQGRNERGRCEGLPGGHPGQPAEPEHGARPSHPADVLLPADCA